MKMSDLNMMGMFMTFVAILFFGFGFGVCKWVYSESYAEIERISINHYKITWDNYYCVESIDQEFYQCGEIKKVKK